MNINFKYQPDSLKGNDTFFRNTNCFLVRHTPHPRRVCHIKGLNNIPICAVNDENDFFKALCDVSHLNPPEKDIPLRKVINNSGTFHNPGANKMMSPRPNSEPCKPAKGFFDEGVLKVRKDELQGRSQISYPKTTQSSTVLEGVNEARSKTICIPNYLDQEIKILSKLCGILQTDSLAELLKWLLHASVKEKQWVSALIHSELSEINLLKNQERKTGKEKEKSSPTIKAGVIPLVEGKPPALAKEEVPRVNRVPSQQIEKNESRQEIKGKPELINERHKLEASIEEYFGKAKPPAKNLKNWKGNYRPCSAGSSTGARNQQYSPKPTNNSLVKF
ncbi:uncharacterized protein C4orf17 homolog [Macrotis lagotis]|uniref:uncharacterized protein C4orf17 homolog n=1 Tax=Macrotis lagotis TaxID=92651 RepID=UPI003D693B6F